MIDEASAELRRLLTRRAELLRQAAELSNAALAERFDTSTAHVSRVARTIAADPQALHGQLRAMLDRGNDDGFMLWQGQDGGIRVRPMDDLLIERPGFIGCVNAATTVADIEEMLEGCNLD